MANQLILPPQKFRYKDITDRFPKMGNASLVFETSVSENQYHEYFVTLDLGATTLSAATKPSPPASPDY